MDFFSFLLIRFILLKSSKTYLYDHVDNASFHRGACDFFKTGSVPSHSFCFHPGCCLSVSVWLSSSSGALNRTDVHRCCRIITNPASDSPSHAVRNLRATVLFLSDAQTQLRAAADGNSWTLKRMKNSHVSFQPKLSSSWWRTNRRDAGAHLFLKLIILRFWMICVFPPLHLLWLEIHLTSMNFGWRCLQISSICFFVTNTPCTSFDKSSAPNIDGTLWTACYG